MFNEIARKYEKDFLPFQPYAPVSDRNAWDSLDEQWRLESVRLGEKYLGFDWPYLSALNYLDFTRTGNRVRFETPLFSKRHALSALVLAECVENKGRFLDDIINGIFSICDESAWCLPPHNSYERDQPQLPLPDAADPVLDLFACETGACLATASYLLTPLLDGFSPFITKRIRYELDRRIFTPYFARHFWWMGDGQTHMNNWTIWCTQNVLLCAHLTDIDPGLRRDIFRKACQSSDYFLAEYGEDGCCDEGAQYYRHAGLCLFQVLDILNTVTGGAFASVIESEKVRNIAAYIYKVHIADKYYVNFADCSPIAGRAGVREFLFAQMTKQPEMLRFAARDYMAGMPETLLLPEENNLYYRLQNGFSVKQIKAFTDAAPLSHPDIYYPSVGLFAVRDEHLYLAVKAGDNGDSHNHNDVGSFTVYKDGKPLFIDVGVESYTKKTFSPQRYEIWTMQSAYHNLPTIDGFMQHDGEEYCATEVSCDLEEKRIHMDIAKAYPAECGLLSYIRDARLKTGAEILIEDHFSFADASNGHQVVLSLMTYEKPEIVPDTPDGCCRLTIGQDCADKEGSVFGTLTLEGGQFLSVEEIPITDARLATAWDHSLYRTLATARGNCLKLKIC